MIDFTRFSKGYEADAGIDIMLIEDVVLKAKQVTVVDLKTPVIPYQDTCILVCPRSSAAAKGIFIATCPVDAFYEGNVHAIVFNANDEDIVYKKGESFCQAVCFHIDPNLYMVKPKKKGWRYNNAFGSSDGV